MKIPDRVWANFIRRLSKIDEEAAKKVSGYLNGNWNASEEALITYAHAITMKYGEASAALCAQMYDALAEASGKVLPPAEPAKSPTYNETASAVRGARLFSKEPEVTAAAVSRLVKQTGEDTLLHNAIRDGAEVAWIPHGDTCAFCLTLASRGWQRVSKKTLRNGHAEHIHNNCDCSYAVRFDDDTDVEGYDPDKYYEWYQSEPGSPSAKINAMQNEINAQNREAYNARKRAEYARRRERQNND